MINISIWGDSVLRGVIYDNELRKYRFLQEGCIPKTAKNFEINYTNNSKFGMTAPRAKKRLLQALKSEEFTPDFVLIELGGNDSDFDWKSIADNPDSLHLPKTTPEEFEESLIQMINALREKGINPVLTNLHPIDAVKYFDWITKDDIPKEPILKWLQDVFKIYRFQEMYSLTIDKVARQLNVMVIDIRKAFLKNDNLSELLCIDGIHPNKKGHEIMADCLIDFINDYKKEYMPQMV